MRSDQPGFGLVSYGVLPFIREAGGKLRPLQPVPAQNPASAQYRAASGVRAGLYEGAIAFSRTARNPSGFQTKILGSYGETPEELRGAGDVN